MSADEQTLLIAGIGYLIAVSIWALSLHLRAKMMLRALGEIVEPGRQLDGDAVAMIDDFRRRTKFMLVICAGAGLLLLIRFWPLLKPDFLW